MLFGDFFVVVAPADIMSVSAMLTPLLYFSVVHLRIFLVVQKPRLAAYCAPFIFPSHLLSDVKTLCTSLDPSAVLHATASLSV